MAAKEELGPITTVKNVEIERAGTKIVLPPGMSYKEGREWLQRKEQEEETPIALMNEIDCYPLDGAVAFHRALSERYGWTNLVPTPGFFGPTPPVMVGIPIGVDEILQVAWGSVQVPGIAGRLETRLVHEPRPKFMIAGQTKRKHEPDVKEIVDLTKKFLREQSIYRGKAIRVSWEWQRTGTDFNPTEHCPKFMDLLGVQESELIFPRVVQEKLELGLYTPIEQTRYCRDHLIPLKRGVLLYGPYGTGKTLTANVTAKKAVDNGWTFIYCASALDLGEGLRFARMYPPAIVFAEDIDKVISGGRTEEMNQLLNTLDGVDSKGAEVITVMTTNHIEMLNQASVRPGRLDTVVEVTPPDADAAARLVELYGRGLLSTNTDLVRVGKELENRIPAFIREVVERAKLATVRRLAKEGRAHVGIKGEVREVDLLAAADQMQDHARLLAHQEKPEELKHEVMVPFRAEHAREALRLRRGLDREDE